MQNKSVELRFAYLLEGCGYLRLNKRPITPHSTDMEFGRLHTRVQYAHHNIVVERSVSFVIPNLLENWVTWTFGVMKFTSKVEGGHFG